MSTSPPRRCHRGHAMTPENTYQEPSGKQSARCRECQRENKRRSERSRKREGAPLTGGPLMDAAPFRDWLKDWYPDPHDAAHALRLNMTTLESVYRGERPMVRLDLVDAACLAAGISIGALYPEEP
jgi:hypothetical protein